MTSLVMICRDFCKTASVRAGRLVTLLLLLERRGRMTSMQLAAELDVSVRTVLRDIDELSSAGVPVYAVRGPSGGFELLDGFRSDLTATDSWGPRNPRPGRPRRATVTITAEGRRIAAVLQVLQPIRMRPGDTCDVPRNDRHIATFRMGTLEATARNVLMLGPEIDTPAQGSPFASKITLPIQDMPS